VLQNFQRVQDFPPCISFSFTKVCNINHIYNNIFCALKSPCSSPSLLWNMNKKTWKCGRHNLGGIHQLASDEISSLYIQKPKMWPAWGHERGNSTRKAAKWLEEASVNAHQGLQGASMRKAHMRTPPTKPNPPHTFFFGGCLHGLFVCADMRHVK